MRIEFIERFSEPYTEEELDANERMNIPLPKQEVKYRRVYIRMDDIFAPKEIPGSKKCCMLELYDGTTLVLKEAYDDVCNKIDDREKQDDERDLEL
jgi:hypothetical protein